MTARTPAPGEGPAGGGHAPWSTIGEVLAGPGPFPGPASLARLSGRLGLGAFVVFVLIGLAARRGEPAQAAIGTLLAVAAAVPLFLVRPRGWFVCAVVATAGVLVLGNANASSLGWFALAVLGAWCALVGDRRFGLTYWALAVLLFGGEWLWAIHDAGWASWIAGVSMSVLCGMLVRHQFVLVERLRAAQAALAERSRGEERQRIARELHDVIAHSLTVTLLHVSSARLAVEHDPADATRALVEAERLGRQSLAEVRATMGLLAHPQSGVAPPVPGADQVAGLVQQFRDAGANVTLRIDGELDELPAITGSTVYRIIQEALTNASKHAPGTPVTVAVNVRGGGVNMCIDSAGTPRHGSGMGLMSMRERAEAVGGSCVAGPGGSGWLVRASLPSIAGSSEAFQ